MSIQTTMLEIRDLFEFINQQVPRDSRITDLGNVRLWFHSSRGHFVDLALLDVHTEIESCPKSFGLKVGRIVIELAPVPDSHSMYFLAGVFRVASVIEQHPVYGNCNLVKYKQLHEFAPFKFRLYISFDKKPNFNMYVRKVGLLRSAGCHVLIGNSILSPPPKNPLDIVDQSWVRLKLISSNPSMSAWRTVLGMYNGLYVIRDIKTEALYVGATFRSILHCWTNDYVVGLGRGKKQLEAKPSAYIKQYFRWSVLRLFPGNTESKVIFEAESLVKQMLGSRAEYLGMNSN